MRFIKSDFRGQLPKLYENDARSGLMTHIIYKDFNNINKEEISRYIKPEQCHYLIDTSQHNVSELEPDYSRDVKTWTTLTSRKILDLASSPPIIRSFYLPYISEAYNSYNDYKLLRNNDLFVQGSETEGQRDGY